MSSRGKILVTGAFPDRAVMHEFVLCDGDYIIARTHATGTSKGPYMGRPSAEKEMTAIPRFETARLILRATEQADLEAVAAMYADPEFSRYITPDAKPQNRDYAWRMMATFRGHWIFRGYGLWSLEEKTSGRCVGWCGPWYPEGWPAPEIGWAVAPACWGRGYATEAARRALTYVRDTLKWTHVIHVINPLNTRSMAVAEKIGSKHERLWRREDGAERAIYGQDL